MAKKKTTDQTPSRDKSSARLEEISKGMKALQDHIVDVQDLMRDGNPYRDAERPRVDIQIRETIRGLFGEQSSEYQRHKDGCLKSTDASDISQTLQILKDLILQLEEQKLGHAGIPPGQSPGQSASKSLGTASTFKPDAAPAAASRPSQPPSAAAVASTPSSKSSAAAPSAPASSSRAQVQSPGALADTLERVKRVGNRFHAVARQLRLRSEYRATLEVDDQYDVQDLFYALLRYEFDDIGTEEWVPSYAEFMTITTFFLDQEQTAVVVKKTQQGRGPKELAEELDVDLERYGAHPACKRLFCFVYDPEGRIGNPRGLEAELIRKQGNLGVEALVAPK